MPTPAELSAALAAANYDPLAVRTDLAEQAALWRLYVDLLELDAAKLSALLVRHDAETDGRYRLRKELAAAFNLVPSILDTVRNYIFGEEPSIDVAGDADLLPFVADCDGAGTPLSRYVRDSLINAMALGWVDTLVQNPPMPDGAVTAADAGKPVARVFTVTPLERLNWSCGSSHAYQWLTFRDRSPEPANPLNPAAERRESVITLAASGTIPGADPAAAAWIRSDGVGTALAHTAGYCPTARVPVASLAYRWSIDPARRHFGVSKIALIAALTKGIIQILSWTTEDILANLAVICMPTRGGVRPTNENGTAAIDSLSAFTVLYLDMESRIAPMVLQGNVSHIEVKLRLVELYVKEILRLSHLSTATGDGAGTETSGFHAVVNRTELFQELTDLSCSLDVYTLDLLALAKSWATGEDWDRRRLKNEAKVFVAHYKGPYTIEPIEQVLKDAAAAIQMFRDVSPSMATNQYRRTARAVLYADDPDLRAIMGEIDANTGAALESQRASALLAEAVSMERGAVSLNVGVSEKSESEQAAADAVESEAEAAARRLAQGG